MELSGADAWHRMILEFGHDVPLDSVRQAHGGAWELSKAHWDRLETSGASNAPETVRGFWTDFNSRMLEALGIEYTDSSVDRIMDWFDRVGIPMRLYPEVTGVLDQLNSEGYRMGIVSDGASQDKIAKSLEIDRHFETVIGSVHSGFRKPMPEIYNLALDTMNVMPEEAVMVGDNYEKDVEGAEAVGIKGLHLTRDGEPSPASKPIGDLRGVVEFLHRAG